MPDLTAANVIVEKPFEIDRSMDRLIRTFPKITVGNGALTYPTGGIPLPPLGVLGLNFELKRGYVQPPADGYIYIIDTANKTLRIFQGIGGNGGVAVTIPNHTHDIKLIGGITATEAVAVQGGDTLGKNAATDRTIAGADSATKGGIVAAALSGTVAGGAGAASPFVELGNVAVALTTLELELVGR